MVLIRVIDPVDDVGVLRVQHAPVDGRPLYVLKHEQWACRIVVRRAISYTDRV